MRHRRESVPCAAIRLCSARCMDLESGILRPTMGLARKDRELHQLQAGGAVGGGANMHCCFGGRVTVSAWSIIPRLLLPLAPVVVRI